MEAKNIAMQINGRITTTLSNSRLRRHGYY
jgi:hypothetical protein